MAGMVITLKKSKFDSFGDILDGLLSKLGSYDATVKDLKNTVASIGCTEDDSNLSENLVNAIDDITNSEDSKEEKKQKIEALKQKIENFVNSSVQHEKAAAEKIKKKKEDFYKDYKNLRPDSEKSFWERAGEKISSVVKKVGKWVSDNIISLVVAALIVIAAIVIVIVCPAAVVAIIAVVVGALSAAMGIADLICIALTGKDVAGWMDEDLGWHTFSKIYKGLGWGLDIASIILPIGAIPSAGANAYKTTFKEFIKHPFKSLKGLGNNKVLQNFGNMLKHPIVSLKDFAVDGAKGLGSGLIGAFSGFKNGIGKGFAQLGKSGLKGLASITGLDKLNDLRKVVLGVGGTSRSEIAMKCLGLDTQFLLEGKNEDRYNKILTDNEKALTSATDSGDVVSTFSEMNVKIDSTPTGASATNDALFNSLKNDDKLSNQLMQTTDLNIKDFQNSSDLKNALAQNGFTVKTSATAGGGSTLSIVPKWTDGTLATDASGALSVLHPRDVLSSGGIVNNAYRGKVITQYQQYMTTKANIAAYQNMASNIFKKNMEYKVFEFGADLIGEDGVPNRVKAPIKGVLSSWF